MKKVLFWKKYQKKKIFFYFFLFSIEDWKLKKNHKNCVFYFHNLFWNFSERRQIFHIFLCELNLFGGRDCVPLDICIWMDGEDMLVVRGYCSLGSHIAFVVTSNVQIFSNLNHNHLIINRFYVLRRKLIFIH